MNIKENIAAVNERIASACDRSGRSPAEVNVIAVTKTVPVEKIIAAHACGITTFGENRVQEAWNKYQQLGTYRICWHMVGHLQTNKVKRAVEFMQVIQSLDSLHVALAVNSIAQRMNKIQEIFLQVNTSGEESKFGVTPEQACDVARQFAALDHLHLNGLMTIGAWTTDVGRIRACFKILRNLKEDIVSRGVPLRHLSMGMSDDFEIAVEEGATILRIGRAIFGERIS